MVYFTSIIVMIREGEVRMKKLLGFILSAMLLFGMFPPITNAATNDLAFCNQYAGVKKIWWDGMELKSGQIGRLMVQKDTELFKLNGEKKTYARTLKAGEFYRIYAFKPGMLSVGGGYYVNRDTKVKYETPSKTKLRAAQCINNPYGSQSNPSSIGESWNVTIDPRGWDGIRKYEIKLVETITDAQKTAELVEQASSYNHAPSEGKKYILAKFNVKLIENYNTRAWDISSSDFTAARKNGVLYEKYSSVYTAPSPQFMYIYPGESTEGWVVLEVDENDNDPLIIWQRGTEETIWFKTK